MDLQIALLIIGLGLIALIFGLSRFAEWKRTRGAKDMSKDGTKDGTNKIGDRGGYNLYGAPDFSDSLPGDDDRDEAVGEPILARPTNSPIPPGNRPDVDEAAPLQYTAGDAGAPDDDISVLEPRVEADVARPAVSPQQVADAAAVGEGAIEDADPETAEDAPVSAARPEAVVSTAPSHGRESLHQHDAASPAEPVSRLADKVGAGHATKSQRIEPTLSRWDAQTDDFIAMAEAPPTDPAVPPKRKPGVMGSAFEVGGAVPVYRYPGVEGFDKISQIDYWARIAGDRDVGREAALAQYREAVGGIAKPTTLYGMRVPDQNWCNLATESEDARFSDLMATIQLADTSGPVSASDLEQFVTTVAQLATGTGRQSAFMASTASALQQAQCIADFIRCFDSVFVINIKPGNGDYLDGGAILRCATQLGLEQGPGPFFVRNKLMARKKICLYSLADLSDTGEFDFENIHSFRTRGVTFFTRPAVNRSPGAVFAEMADTAKVFAARIKGIPSAPNGDELSTDDVEHIRASIEKVAREMAQAGMAAGSDEAMRVF